MESLGVGKGVWSVPTEKLATMRRMYDVSRSAVLLEGEKSASFNVEQGVAEGCCQYHQ